MPLDFINALPDGALVIDASGVVRAANAAAGDALQLDPVGLQVETVLRNRSVSAAIAEARASRQGVSVEIDIYARPQRQFGVNICPFGKAGQCLILLRDLTREQRIERMRADFVANASHEMRTPLAIILGSIETLQGAAKNDPKAQERFLGTMLGQAQRMKRLIDDLLTLSRLEMNEHTPPNATCDLAEIAKQACNTLSRLAKEQKVTVSIAAPQPVRVPGHNEELLQVALNLIENAIKYGAGGERIEVTCEAGTGKGRLAVRDHGPGIAAEHIPRLTERFYRVNSKESRALGGTGLGLAIVKHILLRHRGNLEVVSKPGAGSTFTISIPLSTS